MTQEMRAKLSIARSADYYNIMRTALFTLAGLAAIIELGPDGYSAPLTMMVVATTAFGALGGMSAISDIENLRHDMDDSISQTAYGKGVMARNFPLLRTLTGVLLGLVCLAELYAIFT